MGNDCLRPKRKVTSTKPARQHDLRQRNLQYQDGYPPKVRKHYSPQPERSSSSGRKQNKSYPEPKPKISKDQKNSKTPSKLIRSAICNGLDQSPFQKPSLTGQRVQLIDSAQSHKSDNINVSEISGVSSGYSEIPQTMELRELTRYEVNTQKRQFTKIGLTNIGNTCFMNSVTQMIDSAEELSNRIRQYYFRPSNQEPNMHHYLGQLLCDFQDTVCRPRRNKDLEMLIRHIEKIYPNIQYHSQQDAHECLRAILDSLFKEQPSLRRLFSLRYSERCKCDSEQEITLLFMPHKTTCSVCHKSMKYEVLSCSKYILTMLREKQPRQYFKVIKKDKSQAMYELLSIVSYNGNGHFGHYYAYRKGKDQRWIRINDDRGEVLDRLRTWNDTPKIGLYSQMEPKTGRRR